MISSGVSSGPGTRVSAAGAAVVPGRLLLAGALVVSGVVATAQQPADLPPEKILGKDDVDFVRQLSRNGYTDLAEDVRKAIERSRGGASSLDASLLALELEQERAYAEPDAAKRVELLEGLIQKREEFLGQHPDSPASAEVRNGQLELYRGVGELIAQVLQQEEAAPDAEDLRKRGGEILQRAVTALEEQLAALSAEAPADPSLSEEAAAEAAAERDFQRMLATYGLARTQYFRAMLYDEGSYERNLIANNALEVLLDLQLEFSDQLLCYEGFIYEGLCHKAVGEPEQALESFDAAIELRETYEQSQRGIYQMAPEAADIVSSAVLQKMLLLGEQQNHEGAAAVAKDFEDTTPEPWTTLRGMAILSELADTYQGLGDQERLTDTAKLLIEINPYGPGGQRGREILGEGQGGTLGAVETLRLAESSVASDPDRAIELCQTAMALARGTADEQDLGSRAGVMLGALYAQRNWLHESVVAWHTAADRYPEGKEAPECLWRSVNGYLALQAQERRSLYKELAQERVAELLRRHPDHQLAANAGLIEGRQAEAEQDFARAAELYERITPGSAAYEEALYRAGNASSLQARKLFQEGKSGDAKQEAQRAEGLLVKARTALAEAAAQTLDLSAQERLRVLGFSARVSLANLYLLEGLGRAGDVAKLFDGMDAELAQDPVRSSMVWDLRFRALEAQGKVDDAIALLDAQLQRDPKAGWLEAGARMLAPVLDTRGSELRRSDPRSSAADAQWRKAADYYRLAIQGQVEGRTAVNVETLESVADRLFVFALHFEKVPEDVESFVDWGGERLSGELVELAARAYEAVLPLTPSYRSVIKYARTLGFLGRWEEAAGQYAALFERESFADPISKTIDQQAVAAKPELLFAYLEWGVCEREVGIERADVSRLTRASGIFEALVLGTTQGSKLWWQAKYYQLRTLLDRGEYEVAEVAIKSLKLNWDHFDEGKYGLEPRFVELQDELSKKVFR